MRPIRVAWINDCDGSLGRNPDEEIAEEFPLLQRRLGYKLDLVVKGQGMHVVEGHSVDLLVFDYGGAASGYGDAVWYQFEAMIKWAQEHEGRLVLLYSSFTGKMYENLILSEVGGRFRSENIKPWVYWGWEDIEMNDVRFRDAVRAWFAGGEFEPASDTDVREPERGLRAPGRGGRG